MGQKNIGCGMTQGFFNVGIEEGAAMRKEASDGAHERLKKARGSQRLRSRQRWMCNRCRGPSEGPKGAETNESDGHRRFEAGVGAMASNTHSGRHGDGLAGADGATGGRATHRQFVATGMARGLAGHGRGMEGVGAVVNHPVSPGHKGSPCASACAEICTSAFSNSGESPSVRPLVSTCVGAPTPPPPDVWKGADDECFCNKGRGSMMCGKHRARFNPHTL